MGFEGVIINKADNGLEKGATADRVCVLVAGVKEGSRLEQYTPLELLQGTDPLPRIGIFPALSGNIALAGSRSGG